LREVLGVLAREPVVAEEAVDVPDVLLIDVGERLLRAAQIKHSLT
jgi:hypothetical protein